MIETVESRLKKLEGKAGANAKGDVHFSVFLVSIDADGTVWRENLTTGKKMRVKPESLGIEPYFAPVEPASSAPVVASEPAVLVSVPEQPLEPEDEPTEPGRTHFNKQRPDESDEQYARRIQELAEDLERAWDRAR